MKKSYSKLNVLALICTVLMIVSCFLPWAEVSSRASVMGYSSSYNSSVSGIQSGVGYIAFFLGAVCLVMVIFRSKFMIIPGICNLLFSFFQASAMEDMASNVSTSFGEGHAGPSYGIFILILSCLIYVISCTISLFRLRKKREQPIIQDVLEVITPPVQSALPTEQQPIQSILSTSMPLPNPETQTIISQPSSPALATTSFSLKKNKLSGFQKGLIIFGIIIGVYSLILIWADSSSEKYQQEITQKENYEIERINQIIQKVNEAVSNQQYELALINVNSIKWMLNTNKDNIERYNLIKEDLIATINHLISERDAATVAEKSRQEELTVQEDYLNAIENETDSGDEPPSFPFDMVVSVDKTYLYSEPNVNSDRVNFLTKNDVVTVMASQYDFHFCKYKANDGKSISGWIFYRDIQKYESSL